MSVIGVDFGNLSLLIGQAGKGGVDVILNDSSNRQTATCISIQGKQRFLGDAAAAMARSNITNTISGMKLLVGRKFDSAAVQAELAKYPFKAAKLPNGGVGIKLVYNDEEILVPAEQVLAMMLVKAKDIAYKANNNVNVAESVMAVPYWFTDAQRRGILRACEIAELQCLKITNESNAIALSFGIFKSAKKLFSETEPTHVMFIDLGYTGYCVTIVDFIQENMKVLATVCDRELGGRNFDDVIVEYLAQSFQTKTGIDVRGKWKAILKLQVAAEKAKKTLSPSGVTEASISVECLADDKDLNVMLTRDEFETRVKPLVDRLEVPIRACLEKAGLNASQLHDVEIVGGSTRINIVKRRLGEILGLDASAMNYGLKTTMNSDEAVARGAALQCALMSSRMKVKPFNIIDRLAYGITAHFEMSSSSSGNSGDSAEEGDSKEEVQMKESSAALYAAGDELPHKPRRLTFKRKSSDFTITLTYDDEAMKLLPEGEERTIGKYTIKVPTPAADVPIPDVRVTFNIDRNGLVYIQSAQLMEEYIVQEPADGTQAGSSEEKKDVELITKRKYKKIDLEIISDVFTLSKEQMKQAFELEAKMALEDRLIKETSHARNDLESYLYSMRDKLDGPLKKFTTSSDNDKLKSLITNTEDWLYNDGFDSTKSEYVRKLEELKTLSNPIEARLYENENRAGAVESLKKQIDLCKTFASNYDEAHSHITEEDRTILRNAIKSTETWMFDSLAHQGDLPLHVDPVLTIASVTTKRNELFSISNPIMTKPKPAPTPTPAPAPASTNSDSKHNEESKGSHDSKDSKDSNGPESKEDEKMNVE